MRDGHWGSTCISASAPTEPTWFPATLPVHPLVCQSVRVRVDGTPTEIYTIDTRAHRQTDAPTDREAHAHRAVRTRAAAGGGKGRRGRPLRPAPPLVPPCSRTHCDAHPSQVSVPPRPPPPPPPHTAPRVRRTQQTQKEKHIGVQCPRTRRSAARDRGAGRRPVLARPPSPACCGPSCVCVYVSTQKTATIGQPGGAGAALEDLQLRARMQGSRQQARRVMLKAVL
jgi:hypothetical protein